MTTTCCAFKSIFMSVNYFITPLKKARNLASLTGHNSHAMQHKLRIMSEKLHKFWIRLVGVLVRFAATWLIDLNVTTRQVYRGRITRLFERRYKSGLFTFALTSPKWPAKLTMPSPFPEEWHISVYLRCWKQASQSQRHPTPKHSWKEAKRTWSTAGVKTWTDLKIFFILIDRLHSNWFNVEKFKVQSAYWGEILRFTGGDTQLSFVADLKVWVSESAALHNIYIWNGTCLAAVFNRK